MAMGAKKKTAPKMAAPKRKRATKPVARTAKVHRSAMPGRTVSAATETGLPAIGRPATRALAMVGVSRLEQVARFSRAELLAMHGVGPKAVGILEEALRARKLSLRAS